MATDGVICTNCGRNYAKLDAAACPLCGGVLSVGGTEVAAPGGGNIKFALAFAQFTCDTCSQTTVVNRDHRCTRCGAPLPEGTVDPSVKLRRHTYKAAFERLLARAEAARIADPAFARRDTITDAATYIETVFQPALASIPDALRELQDDVEASSWADDKPSLETFRGVSACIESLIEQSSQLCAIVPPVEMRAMHRLLTRAICGMVTGYLTLLSAVVASDIEDATQRQQAGQTQLDAAGVTASRLAELVGRIEALLVPGRWMSRTVLDFAAIAWDAVGGQPSSVADAATRVRTGLAGIPGAAELSDSHAFVLLPSIVLSAAAADPVLLCQRAVLVRDLIDAADRKVPGWRGDVDEMVRRINSALRQITEQVERVGAAPLADEEHRRHNIHLLVDVYEQMLEGPLRELGAVLVIAARALRGAANGVYSGGVARGVQAGENNTELAALGESWHDAAQMHIRNAGAHGGVNVLDDGVKLTQERTEDGVAVPVKEETISDREFAAEFAALQETALSLQLAVLPWLFTHDDPELARARDAFRPADRELEAVIRALAGINGLLDVTITRTPPQIIIAARPAPGTGVRSVSIPALAPAALHNWPECSRITLAIETREAVTYTREQVDGWDTGFEEGRAAAVGLLSRVWIGDVAPPERDRADLIYVCRPLLTALGAVLQAVIDSGQSVVGLARAEGLLQTLSARVRSAALPTPHVERIDDIRNLMIEALRSLRALRRARLRREPSSVQRTARACADIAERMGRISDEINEQLRHLPPPNDSTG